MTDPKERVMFAIQNYELRERERVIACHCFLAGFSEIVC